jgi:hypothetical protein
MEPVPEKPSKSRRGGNHTKEHLAEISKKGVETIKMRASVKRFEKAQQRKELEQKFAMIQEQMEKERQALLPPTGPDQQFNVQEPQPPKPIPVPEPPQQKQKKTKKIIEVVDDDETDKDNSDSEEEVVIRRIIKKKPPKQTQPPSTDNIVEKTNLEILRNKFQEDVRKRLMSSLFDC